MAAERGGKYLHLNARSIPPFRCFFSRDPLLRLAVSTPSRRLDREPRDGSTYAWIAALHYLY